MNRRCPAKRCERILHRLCARPLAAPRRQAGCGNKGQPSCHRGTARSRQSESARGVARPATRERRNDFQLECLSRAPCRPSPRGREPRPRRGNKPRYPWEALYQHGSSGDDASAEYEVGCWSSSQGDVSPRRRQKLLARYCPSSGHLFPQALDRCSNICARSLNRPFLPCVERSQTWKPRQNAFCRQAVTVLIYNDLGLLLRRRRNAGIKDSAYRGRAPGSRLPVSGDARPRAARAAEGDLLARGGPRPYRARGYARHRRRSLR